MNHLNFLLRGTVSSPSCLKKSNMAFFSYQLSIIYVTCVVCTVAAEIFCAAQKLRVAEIAPFLFSAMRVSAAEELSITKYC